MFLVFWRWLSFFELVNIRHGSLCHLLCLFPLLNMWPLWGQVYFCPVPSSQANKVLLFSPPPVRLQALRSDSCRKYLTTKRHTQKTSYLLWSQKIKPLSLCPSAVSSFFKPQGSRWWFSPQLLISVWVLCPFSHFVFFLFLFYVIILYASGSVFSAHALLLFLGGVHQLLAIAPFYKASRTHSVGFALLCTGTAGAFLRQLGFI